MFFFWNYLVGRKTKYFWNSFSSSFSNVDIGVGQRSTLSPILLALYLSLVFHIFEKRIKNLKIPISILFFVDNRLFITQDKSLLFSNINLFCNYNIISSLLRKFGLIMEHKKMEVFHFSRLYSVQSFFLEPHVSRRSRPLSQEHMTLPGVYIQSEVIILSTYWFLC